MHLSKIKSYKKKVTLETYVLILKKVILMGGDSNTKNILNTNNKYNITIRMWNYGGKNQNNCWRIA